MVNGVNNFVTFVLIFKSEPLISLIIERGFSCYKCNVFIPMLCVLYALTVKYLCSRYVAGSHDYGIVVENDCAICGSAFFSPFLYGQKFTSKALQCQITMLKLLWPVNKSGLSSDLKSTWVLPDP